MIYSETSSCGSSYTEWLVRRQRLLQAGFLVMPGLLHPDDIVHYRALAAGLVGPQASIDYQQTHRSIGSLFDILGEPGFIDLIADQRVLALLRNLGFADPRFQHGIVFNKLPHTPRTFWHQDGTIWNHPAAYTDVPHDLILIYYLVDTTEDNGCLRVIPGSHRRRHPLHQSLGGAYTPDLRRMHDPGAPAFQSYPDEISLPVRAGDVVIIDARLLHAAHANQSASERPALSLWYVPSYRDLPECVRARYTLDEGCKLDCRLPFVPAGWPLRAAERLRQVLPPPYHGSEPALPMSNTPSFENT